MEDLSTQLETDNEKDKLRVYGREKWVKKRVNNLLNKYKPFNINGYKH
jgi:hypothetical protein